jgi:hypothetical protein
MGVPAKGVPVCINKDGTYTVVMNNQPHAFVEIGALQVGAASGNPTLEVTGANGNVELHLDAGATVGGNGTHGTLALDATASVDYVAEITGAKGAALTVGAGGKLSVSGPSGSAAAVTIAVPLTNQAGGKVDITASTNMGMGEVTVVNSGTFDIAHGASVYVPQDSFTQSAGTLAVRGTLTVAGASSTFTLAGGSESGGPVKLIGGTTLVEGPGTMGFDITGNVYLKGDIPAAQTVTVDGRSTNSDVNLTGGTTVKGTLVLDASAKGLADLDGAKGAALTVGAGGKLSVSGPSGSAAAVTIAVPLTNQAGGKVDIATRTGFADGTATANWGAFDIVHGGQVVLSGGSTLANEATGTLRVSVDASTKTASGITGPGVALNGTLAVATMGSPAVGSSYVAIGGPVTGKFSAYSFGHRHYLVRYTSGRVSSNEVLLTYK